jgi:HSP20 family protein
MIYHEELPVRRPFNLDHALGQVLDEFLFGGQPVSPGIQYDDVGDALELVFEAPGVRKDDLKLEVKDSLLTISGSRRGREGKPSKEFKKSFEVPPTVDLERTEALLQDGILTVRLPKNKQSSPRMIPLKG